MGPDAPMGRCAAWQVAVDTRASLTPQALSGLDLPVIVRSGTIGHVEVTVPWSRLHSEPVTMTVEDVVAVVSPLTPDNCDREKVRFAAPSPQLEPALTLLPPRGRALPQLQRHRAEARRSEVAASELAWADAFQARLRRHARPQSSFWVRVANRVAHALNIADVLANLRVEVRRVHVRYEDPASVPGQTVAGGLYVRQLAVHGTEAQQEGDNAPMSRVARIHGASVYWHSDHSAAPLQEHPALRNALARRESALATARSRSLSAAAADAAAADAVARSAAAVNGALVVAAHDAIARLQASAQVLKPCGVAVRATWTAAPPLAGAQYRVDAELPEVRL